MCLVLGALQLLGSPAMISDKVGQVCLHVLLVYTVQQKQCWQAPVCDIRTLFSESQVRLWKCVQARQPHPWSLPAAPVGLGHSLFKKSRWLLKVILFSQWGNDLFKEPGPFSPQTLLPWSHALLLKVFSLPGAEEITQLRKAYPADVRRPENLTWPLESPWKPDVVMLVSLSAGDADSWGGRAIYPSLIGERSFLLKWHLPEQQHLKLSSNLHVQMQSTWWHTVSRNIGRRKIHTSPFTRKGKRFAKKKKTLQSLKLSLKYPFTRSDFPGNGSEPSRFMISQTH